MLKGLLWALLLLVAWGVFRSRQAMSVADKRPQSDKNPSLMVCCAVCRTYLPEEDAYRQDDQVFCGAEHYRAWQRKT